MVDFTLSEEQLTDIERLAAAAYTPKQVAFMLGVKPSLFEAAVRDEESDASIAYYKGLLTSELSIRESILLLARNGSSPAQTLANKLFDENRRNLIKNSHSALDES
jgi:hypothetical protein